MESWNSVLIVQAFFCILGHGRLEVLQSWLRWLRRPLWRLEFLQRLRQITCPASIHPQNLSNHIQTEKKKRFKTPMFHAICKLRSRFWQHQNSQYVMAISSNFIIARVPSLPSLDDHIISHQSNREFGLLFSPKLYQHRARKVNKKRWVAGTARRPAQNDPKCGSNERGWTQC